MNLIGFICEAFGYNKRIYKEIDQVYQKRKYEFYKLAKQSEFYSHPLLTEGSLLQEEYCKKTLGIVEYQLQHSDDVEVNIGIDDIVRKGWKYAYAYVDTHTNIDFEEYIQAYIKKNKGIDNLTDDDLNTNLMILLLIAGSRKDRTITKTGFYEEFIYVLQQRLEHYKKGHYTRISLSHATAEDRDKIRKLKDEIFSQLGPVTDYATLLKHTCNKPHGELFALLFDYDNLTTSIFHEVEWTDKDNDEILYTYINRPVGEPETYYQAAMYIRYLIKAYIQSKQHYFANNKETQFVELEQKEKEIISLMSRLDQREATNRDLAAQVEQLNKKVSMLQKELETEQQKNNELIGLRELMFALDSQTEYQEEQQIDHIKLKTIKAVIIGGHEKWQQRMKELLPCVIFIHPDQANFDLSLLDNVPVFFYVNYLNHGMYYRAVEYLKGKSKIHYINQANENLVLKQIWRDYNDKG